MSLSNHSVARALSGSFRVPGAASVCSSAAVSASGAGSSLPLLRPSLRSASGWVAVFFLPRSAACSVARFWAGRLPGRLAPRVRRSGSGAGFVVSVPVRV